MCQLITGSLFCVLGLVSTAKGVTSLPVPYVVARQHTAVEWLPGIFIGAEVALDATSVTDDDPNHFGYVHRGSAADGYDGGAPCFFVEPFAGVHAAGRRVGQGAIVEHKIYASSREDVEHAVDDSSAYQALVRDYEWLFFAEKISQLSAGSGSVHDARRAAKIKVGLQCHDIARLGFLPVDWLENLAITSARCQGSEGVKERCNERRSLPPNWACCSVPVAPLP